MFRRSLQLGRLAGISVRVHWSILLALLYLFWSIRPADGEALALLLGAFTLLFGAVVLHELGHALVARQFGIGTKQILLLPIGGLAELERPPYRPRDDLLISAAGPLVNLLIAGILALIGLAHDTFTPGWYIEVALTTGGTWPLLLWDLGEIAVRMNLILAGFNLLPIYPLDGGRMLRAALAMGLGHHRANQAIVLLGMPFALGLLVYFVLQQAWLSVLAIALIVVVLARLDPRFRRWSSVGASALFNRADYSLFRGNYEEAIAAYSVQIERRPDNYDAYHNRGAAFQQLRRFDEALVDYGRVIAGDPGRAKAYMDRAAVYLERKAFDLALADLDQAMKLRPDDASIVVGRAIVQIRAGDRAAARTELDRALSLDPRLAPAYTIYGVILLQELDLDGAEQACTRAIALNAREASAFNNRALIRQLRGDDTGVEADLARAIAAEPRLYAPYVVRGVRRMRAGDLDRAVVDLDQAARLASHTADVAWHRARLRHLRGDEAGARAEIERGLALDVEQACVHEPVWLTLFVAGDLPWSLHYYEHILRAAPELAAGYHGRADALRVNGRPAEAIADYNRAIAFEPTRAGAYLGRALARVAIGERSEPDTLLAYEHATTPDVRRAAQVLLKPSDADAAAVSKEP